MPYEPNRTVLTETPWISLTYIFADPELDRIGHMTVVLACHACGDCSMVEADCSLEESIIPDGVGNPILRAKRDAFQTEHSKCTPRFTTP